MYAAKVAVDTDRKKNEIDLTFKIDEGPRVRVAEVVLTGNPKLPATVLMASMKSNRPHGLISWVAGADVYKENKLTEDLEKIKAEFQEHGYMEATVGQPIEWVQKRTLLFKSRFWVSSLTTRATGMWSGTCPRWNKVIKTVYLRSLVKLEKADVWQRRSPEKGAES
jgi:hypothetical protein